MGRLQYVWRSSLAAAHSFLRPPVEQVCRALLGSWVNVLLLCVPAGLALNYKSGPALATFVVNLLAAVGLLGLGDLAQECITSQVGTLYGALLYISTSNLMQMVSSIVLLAQDQLNMLRLSLIGSLLANILLLPALSILYAAFCRRDMAHDYYITKDHTLLLLLAVSSFLIPTVLDKTTVLPTACNAAVSRLVSVFLMLTYGAYFSFQLSTYRDQFSHFTRERNERADKLLISIRVASAIFVVTTALFYFCVDSVVNSLQELERDDGMGIGAFTGFILIPILNCDVAAVEQAGRSMDLMLMYTIGKCIQSALLVAPFLIVVSWGIGMVDLNLSFDLWMVSILFMSVYAVNTMVARQSFDW
ncbi:hypothetical protein VSDG_01850 [Cytospora chrysosperma]|uniref:Sodium/calcium exchanger membrane region domain-containing protein n=1 Tax=Cytospora chrysosperma TaxID=252740 RepID=A0A423WH57_CYTCH|nr:hypothetical protein VSDG_01850 [Valsa sordida]